MSRRAIDANVILRFVTADHPEMSPRCRRLFERVAAGGEVIFLPEAALADVAWTLRSFYHWPPERICDFLGDLLALDGLEMERKPVVWSVLEHFRRGKVDFSDAWIAAEMGTLDLTEIYSFDRDFDEIPELRRIEP